MNALTFCYGCFCSILELSFSLYLCELELVSVQIIFTMREREGEMRGGDGVVVSKNVFLKTKTMYVYIALSRLLLLKHSCPVCLYTRDILLYSYFLCRV